MRSHSSRIARRSSDVKISSCARRAGSAEYIGIKQPELDANPPAATSANSILRIRRSPSLNDHPKFVRLDCIGTWADILVYRQTRMSAPHMTYLYDQTGRAQCTMISSFLRWSRGAAPGQTDVLRQMTRIR